MEIILLGGFLGSGKTTLLLQLADWCRRTSGKELPVAVLENEVGSVGVDDRLVQAQGYAVTKLMAGCACCTLAAELPDAVRGIKRDLDPDVLIIEASGMALPESIRDNVEKYTGIRPRVCLVADASRWRRMRKPLAQILPEQYRVADVVFVSKVDLVDGEELAYVDESLDELCPASAPRLHVSLTSTLDDEDLQLILGGKR